MKRTNVFSIVIWLILAPQAVADPEPTEVVNAFHDALIRAMRASSYEERLAIVTPAIDACFQVHTISRISLGRHWNTLSEDQQDSFRSQVAQLIASTYSSRFNNYNGQVFDITGVRDLKRQRKRVESVLTTRSKTVSLDYRLQWSEGEWRIYDIVANGVSDLSLKRSGYTALFKSGGFDAVMAEISRDIFDNQSDTAS